MRRATKTLAIAMTPAALLCACAFDLNSPGDETGRVEIVGLPTPLVASEANFAGNMYLEDHGLGWTADGQGVIHTAFRYGNPAISIVRSNIGTRDREQLGAIRSCAWSLETSPHGTYVAFAGSDSMCSNPLTLYIGRAPDYQSAPLAHMAYDAPYAWSPDDRLIAYVAPGGQIVVRDLGADSVVATVTSSGAPLAFSPDGNRILVGALAGVVGSGSLLLEIHTVAGDSVTALGALATGYIFPEYWRESVLPLWDQAGLRVVYLRSELGKPSAIAVFNGATGASRTLVTAPSTIDAWRLAAVSSDGGAVAAWFEEYIGTSFLSGYGRSHLYIIDVASGQKTLLANHSGDTYGGTAAFSPDGTRLAFYYAPQEIAAPQSGPTGGIYLLPYR